MLSENVRCLDTGPEKDAAAAAYIASSRPPAQQPSGSVGSCPLYNAEQQGTSVQCAVIRNPLVMSQAVF